MKTADALYRTSRTQAGIDCDIISREGRAVRQTMIASLEDQMEKVAHTGETRATSLVVNLPAPAAVGSPGKLNSAALASWTEALLEGANAAISQLTAAGYSVHAFQPTVSSYNGSGFVVADVSWGPQTGSKLYDVPHR